MIRVLLNVVLESLYALAECAGIRGRDGNMPPTPAQPAPKTHTPTQLHSHIVLLLVFSLLSIGECTPTSTQFLTNFAK